MPNPIIAAAEVCGGQAELARRLDVAAPTVNQWRQGLRPVPVRHCAPIERLTGGKVTRQMLRPDDWRTIWPELSEQPANQLEQGA